MVIFSVICKRINRSIFRQFESLRFKHTTMKEVYFRHVEKSDRFEVTFKIVHESVKRQFNLKRLLSETVEDFLGRIKTNVEKVINAKTKRRKVNSEENCDSLEVVMLQNGNTVDVSKACKEIIFNDGKQLTLNISSESFKVVVNPPWIESISLPQSLMVGFYCYPSKLEILFGDKENSIFEWYKCHRNSSVWTEIKCTSKLLYISEEYLNCRVKLRCIPGNGTIYGPEIEVITNSVIKEGPEECPFLFRHTFTNNVLSNGSFRVVSYNILAEVYAESVTAKRELFPYCPPFALNVDYRKQLYLKEIVGYNADIICLQEVDARIFNNDLCPVLEEKDYFGVLTRKSGSVAEGIATFYAKRKFRLVDTRILSFAEAVDKDPIFSDIWDAIKDNQAVVSSLKARTTVLHALILESQHNTIIVGNTHLFFLPSADHIRLLQGGMASLFLENIVKDYVKMGKKTALLFCGDMNSTPDCGLYQLMTKKVAPADLPDWQSDKTEIVQGIEITQPFEMKSAYGEPKFTNYTVGFSGCLDYIYYQSDMLKMLQTIPLPSEELVKAHTALPSPLFPSDHVALVADFEWIEE